MALSEWQSGRVDRTVSFLRTIAETFQRAHVPFLSASIAYAAFVSLLPLLVLVGVLASALGGEAFVDAVVGYTEAYLSPTGQDLVATTLERATARTGLSLLSVAVLLWAGLRLFRTLDLAFSLLYGTASDADFLEELLDAVVVLAAMTLAVAGTVTVALLFAFVPELPYEGLLDTAFLVAFLTVALLPVYYVFPDRPLSLGEALPGAVVAAVGWTLLEVGFSLYVGLSSTAELYGVIGGVILLVTWLYFGALTILLGATVNVVLTEGARPGTVDPMAR